MELKRGGGVRKGRRGCPAMATAAIAAIAQRFDLGDGRFQVDGRPVRIGKNANDDARVSAGKAYQLVIQHPVFILQYPHSGSLVRLLRNDVWIIGIMFLQCQDGTQARMTIVG